MVPLILNVGARVLWSGFTTRLLYPRRASTRYTLTMRLARPQNPPGRLDGEKICLPLLGIEPRFLSHPASCQLTTLTGISWLVGELLRRHFMKFAWRHINPLNAELNPICHLPALLGAHHILHVSRARIKNYSTGVDISEYSVGWLDDWWTVGDLQGCGRDFIEILLPQHLPAVVQQKLRTSFEPGTSPIHVYSDTATINRAYAVISMRMSLNDAANC